MKKTSKFLTIKCLLIAGVVGFQLSTRAMEGESGLPKTEIKTATAGTEAEHEDIPALEPVEEQERAGQVGQEPTTSSTESAPETTVLTQKQEPKPTEVTLEEETGKSSAEGKEATGRITILSSGAQALRESWSALSKTAQEALSNFLNLITRLIPNLRGAFTYSTREWVGTESLAFEPITERTSGTAPTVATEGEEEKTVTTTEAPGETSVQVPVTTTPEETSTVATTVLSQIRDIVQPLTLRISQIDYKAETGQISNADIATGLSELRESIAKLPDLTQNLLAEPGISGNATVREQIKQAAVDTINAFRSLTEKNLPSSSEQEKALLSRAYDGYITRVKNL